MTNDEKFKKLYNILKDYFGESLPHGIILEEFFEFEIVETVPLNISNGNCEFTIKVWPYGKSLNEKTPPRPKAERDEQVAMDSDTKAL